MMNVLYLLGPVVPLCDPEESYLLVKSLLSLGHRVDVVLSPNAAVKQRYMDAGARIHPMHMEEAIQDHSLLLKFSRLIAEGTYDVVHLHQSDRSWVGHLAAWMAEVPVLVHSQDIPSCPLAEEDFAEVINFRNDLRVLGWSGSLIEGEGLEVLLLAMRRLHAWMPDIELWVEGEGPLSLSWKARVKEMGLDSVIHFIPSSENHREFMRDIDIYIETSASSKKEVSEAMAAAKPIIVVEHPQMQHLIHDGDNGCCVPPNSVEGLCRATLKMIKDQGFARSCGLSARQDAEMFRPECLVERIAQSYGDLVEERRLDLDRPLPF